MFSWSINNSGFYFKKTQHRQLLFIIMISSTIGKELSWSAWAAPAMQSWDPAMPRAAVAHGNCGRWWRGRRQHCCPACGDHTGAAESPRPTVDHEEVKTSKDAGTEALFPIFFLKCGGAYIKGRGKIPTPVSACATSKGMCSADLAGSAHLNRPECLCSVARWVVQGLWQSSLKSMRAFPLISRTLN